jgi:hypothetical protein
MIAFNGGSFAFRNKIINGDMLIAQRGTTFSVAVSSQYTVDRWNVSSEIPARPGRGDITQSNDVPNFEFQSSLRFTTTTISNANTQFLEIEQYIEGYDARDLINQPIIVSFWVKSNKTGTYSVHLNNAGNGVTPDRSYVAEYNINTNNWEKKTIYVSPIDASQGVWNWTNGRGLKLGFTLAGASSNVAPLLNSWVTGDFITSSNQTNLLDTTGNTFLITGVQLEKGPTPTPFEHRPFGTELALCQRYFEYGAQFIDNNVPVTDSNWKVLYSYKVTKRTATPMITRIAGPAAASTGFMSTQNSHWCIIAVNIPSGLNEYGITFNVDAEL